MVFLVREKLGVKREELHCIGGGGERAAPCLLVQETWVAASSTRNLFLMGAFDGSFLSKSPMLILATFLFLHDQRSTNKEQPLFQHLNRGDKFICFLFLLPGSVSIVMEVFRLSSLMFQITQGQSDDSCRTVPVCSELI